MVCRRHCRCQLQPVQGRDLWDGIRSLDYRWTGMISSIVDLISAASGQQWNGIRSEDAIKIDLGGKSTKPYLSANEKLNCTFNQLLTFPLDLMNVLQYFTQKTACRRHRRCQLQPVPARDLLDGIR
jgi:hypothetical protein